MIDNNFILDLESKIDVHSKTDSPILSTLNPHLVILHEAQLWTYVLSLFNAI